MGASHTSVGDQPRRSRIVITSRWLGGSRLTASPVALHGFVETPMNLVIEARPWRKSV